MMKNSTLLFNLENKCELLNHLENQWNSLHETSEVFRYKLNVENEKILNGKLKFVIQLNKNRTMFRRKPQEIKTITPKFNHENFNFNKINPKELIMKIKFNEKVMSIFINNSPLTNCHSLICENVENNLPQILTRNSIEFSIKFLRLLNDRKFRIGYNSPGALASLNHLHLHLLIIDETLFIENVDLVELTNDFYKIEPNLNAKGYCFILNGKTENSDQTIIDKIYKLIEFFIKTNIAHNLFFSFGLFKNENVLKIFIYPRTIYFESKINCPFNIAFCELSGFVPVGNEEIFNSITEEYILKQADDALGDLKILENQMVDVLK